MSMINWSDTLSVHVHEIDGQHQVLIKYINDLDDAMHKGHGKDVLAPLLEGLIKYTAEHFATEEKYFAQYDYPHAAMHITEHHKFVQQVLDFKKQFDAGTVGLTIPLMTFLSDWLVHHIQGSDQQYSDFFNKHGLH